MSEQQLTEKRSLDRLRTGRIINRIGFGPARGLALLTALVLIASFVSVLYHITDVVGGSQLLPVIVLGAIVLATGSARVVSARIAVILAGLVFIGGMSVYLMSIPNIYLQTVLTSLDKIGTDVLGLLAGMSVIRILRADLWALTMTPAPVFLTWHLALRRRYAMSAWAGGLMLGFLTLTGDAGSTATLLGTTSALGLLGLGGLDESDVSWSHLQDIGLVLTVGIVASRLIDIVPGKAAASGSGIGSNGSESGSATIEGSLIRADQNVSILGSISLSPATRFTVTAERASLWHAGAYDRYTGEGWVRSGGTTSYSGSLSEPPGETTTNEQQFRAEATIQTMPASWKPVQLTDSPSEKVNVTSSGDLQPARPFSKGDEYTVTSEAPDWTADQLRKVGTEYPKSVRERYLQVPDSTPSRVRRRAQALTANANNPYDAASVLQRWLKNNKTYSLEVSRPNGNIADGFIFEMDRGYCVYYATAMAVMLRMLGIPARFTVGYTPGQRVADNRWVVRGYDSHAWIEVYFPEVGWVSFDPTPAGPRRAAEQSQLGQARNANESGVDTNATRPTTTASGNSSAATGATTSTQSRSSTSNQSQSALDERRNGNPPVPDRSDLVAGEATGGTSSPPATNGSRPSNGSQTGANRFGGSLPIPETNRDRLTVLASAVGIGLGIYRFGALEQAYESVRLRWQPRTESPVADAVRAFERLERHLTRQYRERNNGETAQSYLAALGTTGVDVRAQQVGEIYERAQYAGSVSRSEADTAIELVDEIVREEGLLPH